MLPAAVGQPAVVAVAKAEVLVGLSAAGVDLEMMTMMKLRAAVTDGVGSDGVGSQIWANPWGKMPNLGIIFPLSIGVKVSITPSSVMVNHFELEGGLLGCASPVLYTSTMSSASSSLGGGESVTIPGLDDYSCSPTDMYGARPTAIKIAMMVRPYDGVIAIMLLLRMFTLGRVVMMFMKGEPSAIVRMMLPILDIVSAEAFDVVVSTASYPVTFQSGTEIPAGVTINVENLSLFGMNIVRKAYVRFVPMPFTFEMHLFIAPISFAGLIELTGIQGEARYLAKMKMAEKENLRLQAEADAHASAAQAEAERVQLALDAINGVNATDHDNNKTGSPVHRLPCAVNGTCMTCARWRGAG